MWLKIMNSAALVLSMLALSNEIFSRRTFWNWVAFSFEKCSLRTPHAAWIWDKILLGTGSWFLCSVCSGPPGAAEVEIQHQPSAAELEAVDEGGRWWGGEGNVGCGGRLGLMFHVCSHTLTPGEFKILVIISQQWLKDMCAVLLGTCWKGYLA